MDVLWWPKSSAVSLPLPPYVVIAEPRSFPPGSHWHVALWEGVTGSEHIAKVVIVAGMNPL